MQIYYVQVHETLEGTFASFDRYYYFNSSEAMHEWIKWFKAQCYSLQEIVKNGEAGFNSRGILNP